MYYNEVLLTLGCSVLALIPPMQIHIFESTSSKPVSREMAKHNLGICMLAMHEMGKSYISAVAAHKLFETAVEKIEKTQQQQLPGHDPSPPPSEGEPVGETTAPIPSWPEGYSTTTAGLVADVWSQWADGMGTQYVRPCQLTLSANLNPD